MKNAHKTVFPLSDRFFSELNYRLYAAIILLLVTIVNPSLNAQEDLRSDIDSIYYSDAGLPLRITNIQLLLDPQDSLFFTPERGYAYHKLGLLFNSAKRYPEAIEVTQEAARIREALPDIDRNDLNNSLFNISVYLRKMGRAAEGEPYLKKIRTYASNDKFYYKALNSLANLKADKGDYFTALSYLDTLIQTVDRDEFADIFINANKNGLRVYSEMPQLEKHFVEIEQLQNTLQSYALSAEEMISANINLGIIYSRLNDNEQAIESYLKVQEGYRLHEDSIGLGQLYTNLGIQYSILKQYDQARFYYDAALRYADQATRADVYDNQGFYLFLGEPTQQLILYQQAINTSLGQELEVVDVNYLPELSLIENTAHELDVLFFLIDKATAWVACYEKEEKEEYLIHAQETLYLIDKLVSSIRLDSEHQQSKLFWINNGVDSYVLAVKVCFLLNDPAAAFYFMERNKSLLLLENLEKANQLETKFLQTSSLGEAIEKHVSEHANLVEFILNEEEGFGLFATEGNTHFFELKDVPVLLTDISRLKKMLARPFEEKEEFDAFDQLSNIIFTQLFPLEAALNQLEGKKLIVIPDYELHSLPFEILTTQRSEQAFDKDYLIRTTELSYLHSCSVYQQISGSDAESEHSMIGFVPTIFKNDTLADLRRSETEMKEIATFFPSELMLRERATKAVFMESLGRYSIIHINSHAGYSQNSTPWLSFYDQQIGLTELANSPNYSNLIILDACKSALGEQELGEGIMSLARAFFYGGSASVIASQWQVNERSSGEIFKAFYENIKAGESKSQALHHAKLAYLASHQLGQLSPYYWASFTLTGDAGHLALKGNSYWLKILSIGLGILLLLVFGRYFLKTNR